MQWRRLARPAWGRTLGIITTALRELMAAGLTGEALALAIERIEDAQTSTRHPLDIHSTEAHEFIQRKRAWDREYRRKRRLGLSTRHPPDKSNLQVKSTIKSSGHPPDNEVAAISFLEDLDLKKERKIARGCRIPPDWKPTADHYELGSRLGFDKPKVESFGQDMRLWAEANAHRPVARKLDWDKTFAGWLRRQKPGTAPPITNGKERPIPP
jgi:hypothetical protein